MHRPDIFHLHRTHCHPWRLLPTWLCCVVAVNVVGLFRWRCWCVSLKWFPVLSINNSPPDPPPRLFSWLNFVPLYLLQRAHLLDNTEKLERSSRRLEAGYQIAVETGMYSGFGLGLEGVGWRCVGVGWDSGEDERMKANCLAHIPGRWMCVFMCVCVGGREGERVGGRKKKKKNLFPWRLMTFPGAHQRPSMERERIEVYRRQIRPRSPLLFLLRKFMNCHSCVLCVHVV